MTACAHDNPAIDPIPDEFFSCAVPEAYPEQIDMPGLVYALNDTYLSWEDCRDTVLRLREITRAP